jgi:transcriptional regulator with XRE-family HTH domain
MPPPSRPAGTAPLAAIITAARLRAGLSLTATAKAAGTSPSHLSRVERGERTGISAELLERLARALRIDAAELLAPAGMLPSGTAAALADPRLARAFEGALPAVTWDALRRLHIAAVADQWRREAGTSASPVDPDAVLRAHRIEVFYDPIATVEVRFPDGAHAIINPSLGTARRRFLAAHAAGHGALEAEPSCDLESQSDRELDATAFAGFLLAPHADLRNAARQASPFYDVWSAEGAALIVEIAERLGIPLWLVARRLAEDGRLAEAADRGER